MNNSLLPLLNEDSNFYEIAPSLFGPEFAHNAKELEDQVKAIRSTTQQGGKPFFDRPFQESGATINDPEETEAKAAVREIGRTNRVRGLKEPNNPPSQVRKSFDNKLQMYSRSSDWMHGGERPAIDRPSSSRKALPSPI